MRALEVRKEPTLASLTDLDEVDTIVTDLDDELGIHDRPTMPVPPPPFESGVRLGAVVISVTGATVDMVTADLSRDPRSESYVDDESGARPAERETWRPPVRSSMVRSLRQR